jgi:integrase
MPRQPEPWFRNGRGWYVQLDGKQTFLGEHPPNAPRPKKADSGRWNVPQSIRDEFHRRMAGRPRSPATVLPRAGSAVVEVLDAFLDWLHNRVAEGTKARRTYDWYRKYLQSFADFSTPAYRVAELTAAQLGPIHVYQWVDSHPGWKAGKRGAMTAVQRAFGWAAKAGLLKDAGGRSPVAGLEKPAQGRREQLVTREEYDELFAALTAPEARDLIELSWETGMRPHELFTAEAHFFDPDAGRLVFPVRLSKGKKVQRVVYLNERALEVIRRNAAAHPTGPLLRNSDGEPWCGGAVNCLFQRVRRELGRRRLAAKGLMPPKIKRLTAAQRADEATREAHQRRVIERRKLVHRLAWERGTKYSLYAIRHAFCTEALENGLDAVTVSVLMGHKDTTMISRVYSHLTERTEHMREAARKARGGSA